MKWGWLKSIFSSGKTTEKLVELADEGIHTDQEKASEDSADTAAARTESHFDSLVDKWSRAIRPAFATWAIGELFGWWNAKTDNISADKYNLILLVMTFYFGGRVILKDLPAMVKAFRGK